MQWVAQARYFINPYLISFTKYEKHALQLSERLMLICCQFVDLQPTRRTLSHHEARMAGSPRKHIGSDGCNARHEGRTCNPILSQVLRKS